MRFLKRLPETQVLPSHRRVHRLTVIRWLYALFVLVMAGWLFDLFLGGLFYLRSDGLVVGEPGVVAAEFTVTVHDLSIREGDTVEKGQVAAIVSSQHVAETIARLSADIALRHTRLSEMRIRNQVVDALLPLAEHRQTVATKARHELERLLSTGLTAQNQRTSAVEMEYQAFKDLEALRAEKRAMAQELITLTAALEEVEKAINDLRGLYDEGRLRSPISGVVARRLVSTGSVFRAGEPMFELYGSHRFVLAYLPTGGMYVVNTGDKVQISSGLQTYRGFIKRIEPYAAALPQEFQRSFTPVERLQVMRVEFDPGEAPPPLFTKVWLKSAHILPGWFERIWRRREK